MGNYYVGMLFKEKSLSHHGIKGQKWGVRRFQYSDGTLTPAGKERYRTTSNRQDTLKAAYHYANKYYSDKKYREMADNALNKYMEENRELGDSIDSYNNACKSLQTAFDKYANMYEANNRLFDGDGTEFHDLLQRSYPEYSKISKDHDAASDKACQAIENAAKSGAFDSIFDDGMDGLLYRRDDRKYGVSHTMDGRAIALAYIISEKDHFNDGTWSEIGTEMEIRAEKSKKINTRTK